jgi:hypothetical protein
MSHCLFRSLGVLLDKDRYTYKPTGIPVSEMASLHVHNQYFLVSQIELCGVPLLLTMWYVSLSHGDYMA